MRHRMLLIFLVTLIVLSITVAWWSSRSTSNVPYERARSAYLNARFLGCTNGSATIQVTNRGRQAVYLLGFVEILARDTNRAEGVRWLCSHDFTNRFTVALGPRSALAVSFPAPTNGGPWRATVGGVAQSQVSLKRTLARIPFFKGRSALIPGYADTDWTSQ